MKGLPLRARRFAAAIFVLAACAATGGVTASAQGVDLAGAWNCCGAGGASAQIFTFTSGSGPLAGTAKLPNGTVFATISGSVSGNTVRIVTTYNSFSPGYVGTFLGTVSAGGNTMSGTWTSNAGQSGSWTATRAAAAPPPPVLGQSVDVVPVSGSVYVKPPRGTSLGAVRPGAVGAALTKGQGFVALTQARQIPAGSQIDARRGTLDVVSATATPGKDQTGTFGGAIFGIAQTRSGREKGLTTMSLIEGAFRGAPSYSSCTIGRTVFAASVSGRAKHRPLSKRVLQTLRASDRGGSFSTRGKYSAATVRGTQWETIDRCDGTLTRVERGVVLVRSLVTRKLITLHAGQSYLAQRP